MTFVLLLLLMSPVQEDDKLGVQVENLIAESENAGLSFVKIFQNSKDAASLTALADEYVNISKPIQAKHFYKLALDLDPKSEAAKAGLTKSEERLKYLDGRIALFDGEIKKTNHYTKYCSKAAVLFHLGRENEAMVVLDAALEKHQADPKALRQIRALRYTFQQGVAIKRRAVSELASLFSKALSDKQLVPALGHLGQMAFLNQGKRLPENLIDKLTALYPNEVDAKHLKGILMNMPAYP